MGGRRSGRALVATRGGGEPARRTTAGKGAEKRQVLEGYDAAVGRGFGGTILQQPQVDVALAIDFLVAISASPNGAGAPHADSRCGPGR